MTREEFEVPPGMGDPNTVLRELCGLLSEIRYAAESTCLLIRARNIDNRFAIVLDVNFLLWIYIGQFKFKDLSFSDPH